MQLLAVEDIGKFVAAIFADPARFGGETFEIASDTITGCDLEALFTEAAGRPVAYALLDEGPLAGHADIDALREINPEMRLPVMACREWTQGVRTGTRHGWCVGIR